MKHLYLLVIVEIVCSDGGDGNSSCWLLVMIVVTMEVVGVVVIGDGVSDCNGEVGWC